MKDTVRDTVKDTVKDIRDTARATATGTCETTPWIIWVDAVITLAMRMGAAIETCNAQRPKLHTWYTAGEPMWMAAESLAFVAAESALQERADREDRAMRARLAGVRRST